MDDPWIDQFSESSNGVTVQNLTDTALPALEQKLMGVPAAVLATEGPRDIGEIAIVLTSDRHLAGLHDEHLGDSSVTDVMTYPYNSPGDAISGDIVISLDRAKVQATEEDWSINDEVLFIAIHGMLHLCGWNDHDDASREAMHRRQRQILDTLNADG